MGNRMIGKGHCEDPREESMQVIAALSFILGNCDVENT